MGKALAGFAVIFGLVALIISLLMTESVESVDGQSIVYATSPLAEVYYVFAGLWLIAAAAALYCLFEER